MDTRNNPVVQATRQYLELFHSEEETSLGRNQVFSYGDDFRALWEKLDNPVSGNYCEHITVIWDSIPQRDKKVMGTSGADVDTGEYLTPLDWAVAYSLSIAGKVKTGSNEYPDLKIFITDLASEARKTSPAVRFFDMFPRRHVKSMPWIRLIKVIPKDETEWSMSELISNAHESLPMKSINEFPQPVLASELDIIRRMWAGAITKTTRADDHHAIANILGPQLLLKDSALAHGDDHVLALRILLRSLGLYRDEDKTGLLSDNNQWLDSQEELWADKLSHVLGSNKVKLSLILIDDQWTDGWGEVICKAVGATYNHGSEMSDNKPVVIGRSDRFVIKASSKPEWLLAHINEEPINDQRFKLLQGRASHFMPTIVFLDLRLFAGRSLNEEAQFIAELVKLARRFPEDEPTLPWPGFSEDELRRVSTWADEIISGAGKTRDDPAYIEALTLLPRILSLVDLALPIVVFSSTGKREITEKFRPYGNVITDFEKPRLNSQIIEDIGQQAKYKFVNAFKKSLDILVARRKCFELVSLKRPDVSIDKGCAFIEMYIDEDGTRGDTVGGCFAIFAGEKIQYAKRKADLFDDDLVKGGVRYFGGTTCENGTEIGPQAPRIKNKKEACSDDIIKMLNNESLTAKPSYLGVMRLKNKLVAGKTTHDDLLSPASIDNLFFLTLKALVELLLFETVPAIIGEDVEVVVSIYAGTRVKFTKDKRKVRSDRFRFGVEVSQWGENLQYSISKDDIYPLVADLFTLHDGSVSVDRAIGIQIPYKSAKPRYPEHFACRKCEAITAINIKQDIRNGKLASTPVCKVCGVSDYLRPDYRSLHYVADEILDHFPTTVNPGSYGAIFKPLAQGQFDGLLDEELQRSLAASRKIDLGDVVGAVVNVMLPSQDDSHYVPSGHYLISTRLAPMLGDIDGREFMEIAARLPHVGMEWLVINKLAVPNNSGDVYSGKAFESANKWPRSGKAEVKKNKKGTAYIGALQEGIDQGKSVFIPHRLLGKQEGNESFTLKISYIKSSVNPYIPYKAIKIVR